ncbi:hypothetical protein NAT51_13715 [Flavobacterium amniphilum]|uniref:hypothetical protein n=1 Tax=Flavobacterium amniphilum TaxID=1834035 RepID=UPI00202A8EFA|nr:hypothetical protein [Flavobacterium amniphilum]MCL9806588.1 hypothetical protein [Flavobacterium amniphilum]
MSYSKEELKQQESVIRKNVFLVFLSIGIVLSVIFYFRDNSLNYQKKRYYESHNLEFNGKVIQKKQKGDHPTAGRSIILSNYDEKRIQKATYEKISISDSVSKRKGSDTVYFYLKNGEILTEDYNEFEREAYFELKKEKETKD